MKDFFDLAKITSEIEELERNAEGFWDDHQKPLLSHLNWTLKRRTKTWKNWKTAW